MLEVGVGFFWDKTESCFRVGLVAPNLHNLQQI
jgi:hypothetical protein